MSHIRLSVRLWRLIALGWALVWLGGLAQADTVFTLTGSSITTSVADTPQGSRMQVSITPAASELDSTQRMYYALLLRNGMLLFRGPAGWQAWSGGEVPALFSQAQSECRNGAAFGYHVDLPPLSQLAAMGLRGASFFAAYGDSEADMIQKQKFALIYTVR
jgi:hypothetical protein